MNQKCYIRLFMLDNNTLIIPDTQQEILYKNIERKLLRAEKELAAITGGVRIHRSSETYRMHNSHYDMVLKNVMELIHDAQKLCLKLDDRELQSEMLDKTLVQFEHYHWYVSHVIVI